MTQLRDALKSFTFTRANLKATLKSLGWAGSAILLWQGVVRLNPSLAQYGGQVAPLLATLGIAAREYLRGDR